MPDGAELSPVFRCVTPAVVQENLMDLHDRVQSVRDTVAALPRERESLPQVRKARAEIRKYFNDLEAQRKRVKGEVMAPYLQAEKAYKALVAAPIQEADDLCKDFVDAVEADLKQECENTLREYFTELCQSKGLTWLKFERVGIRVTMAMVDQAELRAPRKQILDFVERVERDVAAIMELPDSAETLVEYEQCMNVAAAIERAADRKRARELMEARAHGLRREMEERQARAERVYQAAPELEALQEKRFTVSFRVTATVPMLRGLKSYLEGNHFDYQEVTDDGNK